MPFDTAGPEREPDGDPDARRAPRGFILVAAGRGAKEGSQLDADEVEVVLVDLEQEQTAAGVDGALARIAAGLGEQREHATAAEVGVEAAVGEQAPEGEAA